MCKFFFGYRYRGSARIAPLIISNNEREENELESPESGPPTPQSDPPSSSHLPPPYTTDTDTAAYVTLIHAHSLLHNIYAELLFELQLYVLLFLESFSCG